MAKKTDKSSKTAHVLNLITSPADKAAAKSNAGTEAALTMLTTQNTAASAGQAQEAAEAAVVNQQAAQVQQPLIPPILQVAHRHDENLAEQIKGALTEELAAEPAPAASAPASAAQPAPAPEVVSAPAPAAQPEFKLPPSAIMSTFTMPEPPPLPPLEEELNFANIMQMLVENLAPRYVERFGVCGCPRCLEDVKALALTNLGPKYTVFRASERVPMLTLYEKRYASQVATELTKACAVVKANPRHR